MPDILTGRAPYALAALFSKGHVQVETLAWVEGDDLRYLHHKRPAVLRPGRKPRWVSLDLDTDKWDRPNALVTTLDMGISSLLPAANGEVTLDGFWPVSFTPEEQAKLDDGVRVIDSLTERAHAAIQTMAPRGWSFPTLHDAIDFYVNHPITAQHRGESLDEFTVSILTGSTSAAATRTASLSAEDMEKGIPISDGKVYIPRPAPFTGTKTPMTDVEYVRTVVLVNNQAMALLGPPGTGKSSLYEAAFGPDLITQTGNEGTEADDFYGGYQPNGPGSYHFVDSPFVRAMELGVPYLLEDAGLIRPRVQDVFLPILTGKRSFTIPAQPSRGEIHAKDGFRFVLTGNPGVNGSELSEPLMSRLGAMTTVNSDWNLAVRLGVPEYIVNVCRSLDKLRMEGILSFAPQLREALTFRDNVKMFSAEYALSALYTHTMRVGAPGDADAFLEHCNTMLNIREVPELALTTLD